MRGLCLGAVELELMQQVLRIAHLLVAASQDIAGVRKYLFQEMRQMPRLLVFGLISCQFVIHER